MNSGNSVFHEEEAMKCRALRLACTLGLAAAASALYLLTMPGGIGGETDAARWQFMGKIWGVSDSPGYPLYIILNHLFSILPFGTLAWRINLLSAACAVIAVVLAQRILAGLLRSEWLACGGAALLAVSQMFWAFADIAGPYSLNALFVCLVIYLLFRWSDRPAVGDGGGYLYAAFLAYALSLGNELTMLTMLPAIVLFVLMRDRRVLLRGGTIVALILCACAAAGLYGLLLLFTPVPSEYLAGRIETLGGLWAFIARADLWRGMFAKGAGWFFGAQLPNYVNSVTGQFSVLGFVLIAAGNFLFASRYRRKLWFLLAYLAVDLIVALNHYAPYAVYQYVPSYIVLALIMGFSMGPFHLSARISGGARAAGSAVLMVVMAGIVASLLFANVGEMTKRQKDAAANAAIANDVIDALPRGGVILVSRPGDTLPFLYKILGEGYEREKDWRVLESALWKLERPKNELKGLTLEGRNGAAAFDPVIVLRLLEGEEIDWGPLILPDVNRGRREVFFFHSDKAIMDMAGIVSEPVDLKGDAGGKNRYGPATVVLYKVVEPAVPRPASEIVAAYNQGLALLGERKTEEALKVFEPLIEYNPTFAEAQFQIGACYYGMRNYDEARRRWKIVLDLIPGYSPALDALGRLPLPRGQAIAEAGNHSVE
jgi:tetratricopeptide (TPR) repeat protein